MKWPSAITIGMMIVFFFCLSGCDSRWEYYGFDAKPIINEEDGVRITLVHFRQTVDSLVVKLTITNTTDREVVFSGRNGMGWSSLRINERTFTGTALSWGPDDSIDAGSGVWCSDDVTGRLDVPVRGRSVIELKYHLSPEPPSYDLPWEIVLIRPFPMMDREYTIGGL